MLKNIGKLKYLTKEILETQYNVLLIDTAANVNEKILEG